MKKINKKFQTGVKPFIRWAGSKRRVLPILEKFWSAEYKRYIEPFMGSAAFFYRISPKKAILGDINSELINTFISVRDHPRAVFNRLQKIRKGKRSYYKLRTLHPEAMCVLDQAARFIFLNRYCFNGLYRTNLDGSFNVPYAPTRSGSLPSLEHLLSASSLLKNASIYNQDFEKLLLLKVKEGDFVYLDPPYATNNSRVFRQYGPAEFGIADIARVTKVLKEIDSRRAKFVLSYGWCSEAEEAFSFWACKKIYVQRNISGFTKGRRKAPEMLVTNINIDI